MRVAVCVVAAAVLVMSAAPIGATDLWSSDDGVARLEFSGSLRELVSAGEGTRTEDFERAFAADASNCLVVTTFPSCAAFDELGERVVVTSSTRLRMRLDAQLARGLDAVLVYDHILRAGHLQTLESGLGGELVGQSFLGAEQVIASSQHADWRHLLYRGFLHIEEDAFELRAGRQRIAWGEGRLWNPIDRLNAIGPLAIEPDQSPGIDAVDLRWNFTGFDYAQLVYAPGRHDSGSRYVGRVHFVAFDTDVSLLGGLFEDAPTAGFDASRNVGGAAVRIEAIWTDPEHSVRRFGASRREEPDPFWQIVVSGDYNIDVGAGLYVLIEHLYNGNALGFGQGRAGPIVEFFDFLPPPRVPPQAVFVAQSPALFGTSQVISFASQLTGMELGYDLTPEVRGSLLTLIDWKGGSAVLFPRLVYSATGSLELSAGVQAAFGPRRSEYGSRGVLGYARAEWFF